MEKEETISKEKKENWYYGRCRYVGETIEEAKARIEAARKLKNNK